MGFGLPVIPLVGTIDIISSNFMNAFILTRPSLGLLHIISPKFVPELWPLI